MLGTRYEEYVSFQSKLPFVLNMDIERSASLVSEEANWHENIEIQLYKSGKGTLLIDGEKSEVKEGELGLISSGAIHHTSSEGNLVYSCLIIDSAFLLEADIDVTPLRFVGVADDKDLTKLFYEIESLFTDQNERYKAAKLRALILMLIARLAEKYGKEANEKRPGASHQTVKAAIKFIKEHYSEKISLKETALASFCDKYTLAKEFKRVTGKTLVEYLNSYRIKCARALLVSGDTVFESARKSGFTNMSYFTRIFKRQTGKLPSEIKNRG